MPLEECRNIYFGRTADYAHVYLGGASAKFAKFLYDKVGIPIELEKTDIFASVQDYDFLVCLNAGTFKRDVTANDVKVVLEAYDILKRNGSYKDRDISYSYKNIYINDLVLVMYNKSENVCVVAPNSEFPEYKDSVLTCLEWTRVARYVPSELEQITVTGEKVRDVLCALFNGKRYEGYADTCDRLCAFNKLYIQKEIMVV